MISFLLNNFFVLFFFKLNCSKGEKKPLETKPRIGVNPDSRLQNAKWERKKWKHWLFAKPYNNSDLADIHVVLMGLSFQRLAWASRNSLSWWLGIVICPSIHLLLPLWIWWPLGFVAKSRCSIWLGNPWRAKRLVYCRGACTFIKLQMIS